MIREEIQKGYFAIDALVEKALDSRAESELVEQLRYVARPLIALVTENEEQLIGHVMFSPITLTGHADLRALGLTPVSVASTRQGSGVGSALVFCGLAQLRVSKH